LSNVDFIQRDALNFTAPVPLDIVLFSLSYNTIPHHAAVLSHAWRQLKPCGRLAIMDAKLPDGHLGKIILPAILSLMRHTVIANPMIRPWEELQKLAGSIEMTPLLFSYHICLATKQQQDDTIHRSATYC